MHNPRQMVQGLTRIVDSILDNNQDWIISVCASGRRSVYLATLAMLMGLHVRLGSHQFDGEDCSGSPDRVTQCDGAAVHVGLLGNRGPRRGSRLQRGLRKLR